MESQKYPRRKREEDRWSRLLPWFRVRFATKARHAGEQDGKGGDEAAAKDEGHGRYDKKIKSKDSMDAKNSWWIRVPLAADCQKL